MGNIGIALRGLAIAAMLVMAWYHLKSKREAERSLEKEIVEHGLSVFAGDRNRCHELKSLLASRGIRSCHVGRDDGTHVYVAPNDERDAREAVRMLDAG